MTRVAIHALCALLFIILILSCNSRTTKIGPAHTVAPSNSPTLNPGPLTYVALGDSTGTGVGATEGGYVARLFKRLVEHRPNSELTNLCFSGATTSDVLRSQLNQGVRANPDLVTLGIGINDIGHGVSLEEFSRNYEEILNTIKTKTQATILVTNIPDISSAPRIPNAVRNEYHQRIVEFNQKLEAIALAHEVILVDIYTITHQQKPLHPEFFSADGFHPSDKGYELWAEHMWPTIGGLIGVNVESKP